MSFINFSIIIIYMHREKVICVCIERKVISVCIERSTKQIQTQFCVAEQNLSIIQNLTQYLNEFRLHCHFQYAWFLFVLLRWLEDRGLLTPLILSLLFLSGFLKLVTYFLQLIGQSAGVPPQRPRLDSWHVSYRVSCYKGEPDPAQINPIQTLPRVLNNCQKSYLCPIECTLCTLYRSMCEQYFLQNTRHFTLLQIQILSDLFEGGGI